LTLSSQPSSSFQAEQTWNEEEVDQKLEPGESGASRRRRLLAVAAAEEEEEEAVAFLVA